MQNDPALYLQILLAVALLAALRPPALPREHLQRRSDHDAGPGRASQHDDDLEQAQDRGYVSHFIGKWHVGMASLSTQTPQARDFETTLNYFDSGNNYYDSTTEQNCLDPETQREVTAVDLWNTTGPTHERHV